MTKNIGCDDKAQALLAAVPAQPNHPTGRRKWLYRLLSVIMVPAVFLLCLEAALRLGGYGYPTDFFLAREINGQPAFVDNPAFGRRFFPPGLSRAIDPMVMPAAKEPGTCRIFILGESAAQGFPDPSSHFGRILRVMLQQRYPETRFEIVNTALVAINSHVIVPIARECAGHEPDLFVVYMGNNEVVGPFGASGVLGAFNPSLSLIRASVGVKASRTGQLLADVTHRICGRVPRKHGWGGMEMFMDSQVPAGDPRLAGVYAHLADNLSDICAAGRKAGAKVLVCTVPVNLRDCAPFASRPSPGLTGAQVDGWKAAYAEAIERDQAGDHAAALAGFLRALAIDDRPADLHFRLGRCYTALKKPDDAHRHFLLARDRDALRFRADSGINQKIRGTASGREDEGVYLVDAEKAFAESSPGGSPGEELFYEHVHLKFDGNYLLARTVFEHVVRVLPDSTGPVLSLEQCKERLPFTDWNRMKALTTIADMGLQPPFPNQLDHAEQQKRWRGQLAALRKRLDASGAQAALALYRHALERDPGDFALHKDFALLLWEQGDLSEAARHLQEALKLVPHDHVQHSRLAQVLWMQGKFEQAIAASAESLRLQSEDPQLHNVMGRLLLSSGKSDQAAASFRKALKLNPDLAVTHLNLGDALAGQQKYEGAAAEYEEALRLEPNFVSAHLHLGRMYANLGRFDGAQRHFQEALRIDAKDGQIHADYAAVLANAGNIDGAIAELEEALRLRPDLGDARRDLDELRRRRK